MSADDLTPAFEPVPASSRPPETLAGRYRTDLLLKRGFGIDTWLGTDVEFGGRVVIKVAETDRVPLGVQYTLEHDTRVLGILGNRYLAAPLEVGHTDGLTFLVRPYVPGVTLQELLDQRTLNVQEWTIVARCVLSAMRAAHDAGVLHRDITTGNIIVNEGRSVEAATLIDFGLARSSQLGVALSDRASSVAYYISPEQAGVIGRVADNRSDLYSLGAVLFECIAGRPPVEGESIADLLRSHMSDTRPTLRGLGFEVPQVLDEIIGRMLLKDPNDRYQAAGAALDDVMELANRLSSGDSDPEFVIGMHDRRSTVVEPAFIGRSAELTAVASAVERSALHGRQLVYIEAESGGGKTRLQDELAAELVIHGTTTYRGRGSDEAAQRPFECLRGVFEEVLAAAGVDPTFGLELRDRLTRHATAICEAFPRFTPVLLGPDVVPEQLGAERFGQQRSIDAICAFVDALGSASAPVVLILDDLQWADEQTVGVIRQWHAQRTPGYGVSIVGAFRSEEVGAASSVRRATPDVTVALAPMSDTDIRRIAESMAGALPEEALELVERLAQGSPFMASAVLRGLVEVGALMSGPRGWTVEPNAMDDVRSSKRAADLIDQRIGMLEHDVIDFLVAGAVLGKEFDVARASSLADLESDKAFECIAVARRRHIVWGPSNEGTCTFVHDKLRARLLSRIPPKRRQRLHRTVAAMLEASSSDAVFEIAFHYHQGGMSRRAFPFAIAAARRARGQHSLVVARTNYEIAEIGAEEEDHAARFEIALGLGAVHALTGEYDAADAQYSRAFQFAATPTERAEIDTRLGELAFKRGDVGGSEVALERAARILGVRVPSSKLGFLLAVLGQAVIQVLHSLRWRSPEARARPSPPPIAQGQMTIYSRLAYAYWFGRGAIPCLWAHLTEMNLAERYGPSPWLGQAWSEHGPAMSMLPWTSRGLRYVERSLRVRRQLNDVWGQGQTYHFAGVLYYAASRYEECIEHCKLAISLLERTGDRWEINASGWQMALAMYRLGDLRGAVSTAKQVYASALEIGDFQAAGNALGVWAKCTDGNISQQTLDDLLGQQENASADVATSSQIAQASALRMMHEGRFEGSIDVLEAAQERVAERGARQENVVTLLPWIATARRLDVQTLAYDHAARMTRLRVARRAARRAHRRARLYRNNLPHALRERGYLDAMSGRRRRARRHLDQSIEVAVEQGARSEQALSMRARGRIGLEAGWPHAQEDLDHGTAMLARIAAPTASGAATASAPEPLALSVRFEQLIDIGRSIVSATTHEQVCRNACIGAEQLLQGEVCAVLRVTQPQPWVDVEVVATVGDGDLSLSPSLLRRAFETGRTVVLNEDERARDGAGTQPGTIRNRSAICAPIRAFGLMHGCLYVAHGDVDDLFGAQAVRLADYLAVLAGATLEQVSNLQVLRELSASLERRVSERTAQLARANAELDHSLAGQRAAFRQASEDARRLEEAIRIKDRFVSMVSHELRTPLTSIIGFADTLRAATIELTDQQRHEFLDIVQSQAHRLGRLVDELLTFSRIQRGAVQPRREPTRLLPTINDVVAELNLDAGVQVSCDGELEVAMSSDHITQVLSNLLSNAERYGAPPFEVVAREVGRFVEIRVVDHGDGVSDDFIPLLFTEFTRDQRNPAANGPGFGLGLSIVVALVTTYGGEVAYESVEPHGAAFIVRVPSVTEDELRKDE